MIPSLRPPAGPDVPEAPLVVVRDCPIGWLYGEPVQLTCWKLRYGRPDRVPMWGAVSADVVEAVDVDYRDDHGRYRLQRIKADGQAALVVELAPDAAVLT